MGVVKTVMDRVGKDDSAVVLAEMCVWYGEIVKMEQEDKDLSNPIIK
jgi:hypothetical protein